MAGLSVLLETHKKGSRKAQNIISKATLHHPKISSSSFSTSPSPPANCAAMNSFLQRCFLCRRELADGKDIYMYRGDRAFCSVECRHRQIFMDEDGAGGYHCTVGAAAARNTTRRASPGAGGFAY